MVSAAPGLGGIAKKKNVLALSPLSFWTASMDLMSTWRNQVCDGPAIRILTLGKRRVH